MGSKFAMRVGVQPTPKICKAVGDSFRFVSVPFKREMSWSTVGSLGGSLGTWELNGTGLLHQQGNPIQVWNGSIGPLLGDHANINLFYDDIVNVLTIHYFALKGLLTVFGKVKIIANIDLEKPFGTRPITLTGRVDFGDIIMQLLY